jgi:predicted transcriptional regulator
MGTQTERIDLRVDPELREALERIAVAKDRSLAWIVREALKRYVEEEQKRRAAPLH